MANSDVVNLIISATTNMVTYMLPIIALMTGITFIFTFLVSITVGLGRRTFRG